MVDTLTPCKTCIIKNHCGGGCRGVHFSYTQDYLDAHPLFRAYLRRSFEAKAWDEVGGVPEPRRADFCAAPDAGVQRPTAPAQSA